MFTLTRKYNDLLTFCFRQQARHQLTENLLAQVMKDREFWREQSAVYQARSERLEQEIKSRDGKGRYMRAVVKNGIPKVVQFHSFEDPHMATDNPYHPEWKSERADKEQHDADTRELLDFIKETRERLFVFGVNPARADEILRKYGVIV